MKAKHILVTVLVSAVTALTSVFLYSKFTKSNQLVSQSQAQQLPVNYAGLFDGGTPGSQVDFEAAANTSVAAVVHIKTKTNPTQTSNQQKRRSPFGDMFGDDFFDDFLAGKTGISHKWQVAVAYLLPAMVISLQTTTLLTELMK